MAIETICQGCSKKLRVADEHAGKQARCPSCGQIYVVPQPTPSSYSPLASNPALTKPSFPPPGGEPESNPFGQEASTPVFANPPAKQLGERWFMKIDDGREFGPVDRATLDQWLQEKRIGPTTRLKREYDNQWQPASNVYPSLASRPIGNLTSANPFADQPQGVPINPYASGQFAGPTGYSGTTTSYVEPHRGVLILVLAIASWFVCFLLAIAAWVMANEDLRKMRTGKMDSSGYGLTQAGQIIAIIQVVLVCGGGGLLILFSLLAGVN